MGGIRGVGGTEGERGGKAGGWTSGKQLAVAHGSFSFLLPSNKSCTGPTLVVEQLPMAE
jgi:hypothetical protein